MNQQSHKLSIHNFDAWLDDATSRAKEHLRVVNACANQTYERLKLAKAIAAGNNEESGLVAAWERQASVATSLKASAKRVFKTILQDRTVRGDDDGLRAHVSSLCVELKKYSDTAKDLLSNARKP